MSRRLVVPWRHQPRARALEPWARRDLWLRLIYGYVCTSSDQEEKRAVTFAYVAPLKGIVISGYFEPWDSFGPRVPRKVISCRGSRFLLHDIIGIQSG